MLRIRWVKQLASSLASRPEIIEVAARPWRLFERKVFRFITRYVYLWQGTKKVVFEYGESNPELPRST